MIVITLNKDNFDYFWNKALEISMNIETVELEGIHIPKSTFEAVQRLTERQNANFSNNIGRLLNAGLKNQDEQDRIRLMMAIIDTTKALLDDFNEIAGGGGYEYVGGSNQVDLVRECIGEFDNYIVAMNLGR